MIKLGIKIRVCISSVTDKVEKSKNSRKGQTVDLGGDSKRLEVLAFVSN